MALDNLELLDKETLRDRAYGALRRSLLRGDLVPGQSITIRSLSEALGTSHMPVREALRQLVAERILEIGPNRTVHVPNMTRETFQDLCDIRVALEGMAAERAASRIRAEEIAELDRLCDAMRKDILKRAVHTYLHKNQAFHFGVYRASRSDVLVQQIETLWLRAGPFIFLTFTRNGLIMGGEHHHEAVLHALKEGDGEAARRAMAQDIIDSAEYALHFAEIEKGLPPA